MSSSQTFILKYVLPSGKVLGYHLDTSCHIGKKNSAKKYTSDPAEQIEIVKRNFAWVWNNSKKEYRTHPAWEGASLEQIQIVAEAI